MVNTLRPRQNGRHLADDIFKRIFLNENIWIPNKISLKFVLKGSINNIPALVQIMAWRLPGDKPLSEPMMVSLLMHLWVTRPQWVNELPFRYSYLHFLKTFLGFYNTNPTLKSDTAYKSSVWGKIDLVPQWTAVQADKSLRHKEEFLSTKWGTQFTM